MIHWDNSFQPGMAYVMLGRTQKLEDIYIVESKDKFSTSGIKVDEKALKECERIRTKFEESKRKQEEVFNDHFSIAFLNVFGLVPHLEDVKNDPYLEKFDVISFGETWLNFENSVHLDGRYSCQNNVGRGKGLATFVKDEYVVRLHPFTDEKFSVITMESMYVNVAFLYLSKGANWERLSEILEAFITNDKPIAIMGDMNFDFNEDTHPLKSFLFERKFDQLIKSPTHDYGRMLDHIYVNELLIAQNPLSFQRSTYYSDHDIISLHVNKV